MSEPDKDIYLPCQEESDNRDVDGSSKNYNSEDLKTVTPMYL